MNSVADEEMLENDVNYGIADCRRRLRTQRSTLRAQHFPPKLNSDELSPLSTAAQLEEREEAVIT
ncbi:MAG TPA: hypothetical protein VFT02_09970 [Pyrinomonadaceae bacterium]|nr:hypothetical protein [Pyrinomonadaceae bacterium]